MPQNTAKNPSNSGFLDNILDQYDNPAYHFKLYMLSDIDMYQDKHDNKIIIAESGVTSQVGIEDVEIISYVAPNNRKKNMISTEFDFKLIEANNAQLIDKIVSASLDVGIGNYMNTTYYLELTFRGRDRNTGAPAKDLSSLKWRWDIKIATIDAEVDVVGTVYTVKAYSAGDLSSKLGYDNMIIDKAITISADNVGNAITKLFDVYNAHQKEKSITAYRYPDEFSAIVHPDLQPYTLLTSSDLDDMSKTSTFNLEEQDAYKKVPMQGIDFSIGATDAEAMYKAGKGSKKPEKTMTFNSGTTILDAINRILASSPTYISEIKRTADPESSDVTDKELPKQMHRVLVNVRPIAYDMFRADYVKSIEFNINPYEIDNVILHPVESSANGKQKYNVMKGDVLNKRYFYNYTGLNDQVINFDLKFNLAWAIYLPTQAGVMIDYENASHGQHIARIRDTRDLYQKIRDVSMRPDRDVQIEEITKEIQSAQIPEDDKEYLSLMLSYIKTEKIPDRSNSKTLESPQPKFSYVEDYSPPSEAQLVELIFKESSHMIQNDDAQNVENSKGSSKHVVNALYQQAFETQGSNNAIKIDLEVKGDPYWLETNGKGLGSTGSYDMITKHPAIIFSIRQPQPYDNNTGVVKFSNSPFTGVYNVNQVTHKFSNGMFTQNMICYRNAKIKTSDLKGDV